MKVKLDLNIDLGFSTVVGAVKHFVTITNHKLLVMKGCFQVGLYWQGLTHDLSKYAPCEFMVGARYYQGDRSPNNAEREDIGYSSSWLHHKGRNRHHYEYWVDYSATEGIINAPVKMPERYFVELVMDRIAASKNYQKEKYTDASALEYFRKGREHMVMHPDTAAELEKILVMLSQKGEAFTFAYIRERVLNGKSVCAFDAAVKGWQKLSKLVAKGIDKLVCLIKEHL